MKKVLVAYDVSKINDKAEFLSQLCELHEVPYSFPESYGEPRDAKVICIAQYTSYILPISPIVTRVITYRGDKEDFRDWWDYKGPILPATIGSITLGSL